MKVAIISDLHANYSATKAVFDAIYREADALIVAGDLVGYYFEPSSVIDAVRGWKKQSWIIQGNHDTALIKSRSDVNLQEDLRRRYGPGNDIALKELNEFQWNWIKSKSTSEKFSIGNRSVMLCHGSPENQNQYVYPDSDLQSISVHAKDLDLLVLGHTHYPMLKKIGKCLVVNPGSVGQPRNRVRGAAWAMLDTENMTVKLRIQPYSMDCIAKQCSLIAPDHPYLLDVLTRS